MNQLDRFLSGLKCRQLYDVSAVQNINKHNNYPEALLRRFYIGAPGEHASIRRAFDRKSGQYYLLKGPFTEQQRRIQPYILNEARMLLRLRGIKGVPELEGIIRAEGRTWLIQQWLQDVRPVMGEERGSKAAGKLVLQLAPILAACHSRGVCHCDLRPANLGYSHGRLWLLDFGAALFAGTDYPYKRQLSYGFAAPDLLQGKGRVTFADDNFSLLIMVWIIWTGRHPFGGRIPENTALKVKQLSRPAGMKQKDFSWFQENLSQPKAVSLGETYIRAKNWL